MRKFILILLLAAVFCPLPVSAVWALEKTDGIHKTNYSSGELRYESMYKHGKLNGITKEYDKEGDLIAEYEFKDGKLVKKIDLSWKKRDFGKFSFLTSWKFWLIFVVVLVVLWFACAKIFFVKRPF